MSFVILKIPFLTKKKTKTKTNKLATTGNNKLLFKVLQIPLVITASEQCLVGIEV